MSENNLRSTDYAAELEAEQESPDYETADDRQRERIEATLHQKLTCAEVAAAASSDQSLVEYVKTEYPGARDSIEASSPSTPAAFAVHEFTAELPSVDERAGDDATAESVLTPGEIQEAKAAGITATQLIERDYHLDATLYTPHTLADAMAKERQRHE